MTVDGKIATSSGDSKISSRKDPARVIVDSRGRTPLDSQIMRTASKVKTIVAVTDKAPEEKLMELRDMGAEVLVISEGKKGRSAAVPHGVNLKLLFRKLENMGLKKILVEGGGELNWSLLHLWLVDELTITIAPKIAGGRLATTLVEGDGFDEMAQSIRLQLKKIERKKGGELVLHYKI